MGPQWPLLISNKVVKGLIVSQYLEEAASYFPQKFTKLIRKHFQSNLQFTKTFISQEPNSCKKYISKNCYQNKNYIDIHSMHALPLQNGVARWGGRGESKNFRKISGVVKEGGLWGWVKRPERGGIPVLGVFLLGISTPLHTITSKFLVT